jgi:hypothetical protein
MFQFDISKAVGFLESQYDPEVGLLREAPRVQPNWFWLWIDNRLAMHVLIMYQRDHPLAVKILEGLDKYASADSHGRMEVVLGDSNVVFPWVWPSKYTIDSIDGKKVLNEVCNGSPIGGWTNYADLLFLAATYYAVKGGWLNKQRAKYYLSKGQKMWGGQGFSDCIAKESGRYATYKLALYLIAAKRLGITSDINDKCRDLIGQQQAPSGGVWTDYIEPGYIGVADVNTETTTLCILASL